MLTMENTAGYGQVIERQIRQVIESMQTQSPKQALAIVDKCLKKHPKASALLATKALVLVHLGRDQLGLELAQELVKTTPTDILTLGNLDKVYVALNDYKSASFMYEQAYKLVGTEDIGVLWFFSVVRLQDSKQLFTIALKLYNSFKNTRYLFWAVTALHLRSLDKPSEEEMKHLRLAESLLSKVPSIKTAEEVLLLVLTVEHTENYANALRVLEVNTNIPFSNPDERELLLLDLMVKAGHWNDALTKVSNLLLTKGIFDWTAWKLFVQCLEKADSLHLNQKQDLVKKILLIKVETTDPRSVYLANIDSVISIKGMDSDALLPSIMEYIDNYQDKGCCLYDLQYLSKSMEEKTMVILRDDICWTRLQSAWSKYQLERETQETIKQFLFYLRLYRILGGNKSHTMLQILATINVDKVDDRDRDGKMMDPELASSLLYHVAILLIEQGKFLEAMVYCERALAKTPENFVIRLVLLLLLLNLGAIYEALNIFKSLDIKQIQLDTLAYLLSDHLLDLGDLEHAESFFHEAFFIYDDNRTQSWSLLSDAFGRNAYAQVPELFRFARRLEHSVQAVACIIGTIRTELLTRQFDSLGSYLIGLKADELLFEDSFLDNLCDNRDRDVIDFCDLGKAVRHCLLDPLLQFDRASIWAYTMIPLVLRGLLFGNHESGPLAMVNLLARLEEKALNGNDNLVNGSCFYEKIEWVKNVLCAFIKYFDQRGENELWSIKEWIDEQIGQFNNSLEAALEKAECLYNGNCYQTIVKRGWIVEKFRWMCLVLFFFIRGQPPKTRKLILKQLAMQFRSIETCAINIKSDGLKSLTFIDSTNNGQIVSDGDCVQHLTLQDIELSKQKIIGQHERSFKGWRMIIDSGVECLKAAADLSIPCPNFQSQQQV